MSGNTAICTLVAAAGAAGAAFSANWGIIDNSTSSNNNSNSTSSMDPSITAIHRSSSSSPNHYRMPWVSRHVLIDDNMHIISKSPAKL